jgi:hypothetical protein
MWYGIALHRYIEYSKTRGKYAAIAYIREKFPRQVEVCKKIRVDEIPDGEQEQTLLIDLKRDAGGSHTKGSETRRTDGVQMKADLRSFDLVDGVVMAHIIDYKTGDRVYALEDNDQLLTGAAASYYEFPHEQGVRASIFNIHSDGSVHPTTIVYPPNRLREHFRRCKLIWSLVRETRAEVDDEALVPEFVPGAHCRTCRASSGCPNRSAEAMVMPGKKKR